MSRKKREGLTAAELAEGLIISVGEARKLLGADALGMSDNEIAVLILGLYAIAPDLLKLSPPLIEKQL